MPRILKIVLPVALLLSIGGCVAAGYPGAAYPSRGDAGSSHGDSSYGSVIEVVPVGYWWGYWGYHRPYRARRHYAYPHAHPYAYSYRAHRHHGYEPHREYRHHDATPHRAYRKGYGHAHKGYGHAYRGGYGSRSRPDLDRAPRHGGGKRMTRQGHGRHDGRGKARGDRRDRAVSHPKDKPTRRARHRSGTAAPGEAHARRYRSPGETAAAFSQRYEKARREAARESLSLDRLLAEGAVPEK